MDSFVVQFHDAYGHHAVRKVSCSLTGAQRYITATLADISATDIAWDCSGTFCSAHACLRGQQAGFELVSYSIEKHEISDCNS